jgi:ribosome-interacting GTPase 1
LEGFGIRLNKRPPAIVVRRKEKGGIAITNTVPLTNIDQDEIKAILSEYRINNVDIAIREPNATADDLVDVIEGNRFVVAWNTPMTYAYAYHSLIEFTSLPSMYVFYAAKHFKALTLPPFKVLNKVSTKKNSPITACNTTELDRRNFNRGIRPLVRTLTAFPETPFITCLTRYKIPMSVPVSSREWLNIDELIDKMWETLSLVRVYTKPRALPPDYNSPVVLRQGKCSVEDFCNSIHKEIAKQMK